MVVKYKDPTCIWFNIKYKIFKSVEISDTHMSLISSFGGRPIGMIEVVEFEKITDDFYWFTLTSGKHIGLHICDFTVNTNTAATTTSALNLRIETDNLGYQHYYI